MEGNNIIKKGFAVAIILLFISVSVIPSTGTTDVKQITVPTAKGDTLYVGGNGTGNYSKIQDAINNASDGDTIYVYDDSSPYYENLVVNKSINLIGEDRDTTIIYNNKFGENAVEITENYSNIRGFTLTNSYSGTAYSGVCIKSDFNNIQECKMINNKGSGITLFGRNNLIDDNIISENENHGIYVVGANSIMNNTISNNSIIFNIWDGIYISDSYNCHNYSKIHHNDFINNRNNARDLCNNIWDNGYPSGGNYWDDYTGEDNDGDGIGDIPYRIDGSNYDRYPFMKSLKEYDEPIAYFTYDIDDLTVVFNASLSFDPDGTITNWAWDFGDGVEGAGIQVSHTYQTYGIYNVTLTVSDNDGKEDNIIKTIIIEKPELLKTTFIVGRLDNLSFELLFGYSFEAVKIIAISFFPFNYYFLKSGEEIKITRYYLGRLNEKYIFAICGAFIDE